MTSANPARRPQRRTIGRRSQAGPSPTVRSGVGDRLRDARENRGVDLYRVERDTKIRSKYLAALEDGEFSDLPGDVYARGFLRNYASYLGLDPDEIEEEWREEAGEAQPVSHIVIGPRPLTMRRKIVFQQSHVVIGVVGVIVLIVAAYFGFQLTRYLSYPTLAVASAGPSAVTVGMGQTQYTLTGTATPNTTVLIAWNGHDPKVVTADDQGNWTFPAVLQPGSNQFDVTAKNLDTSHASNTVRLIVFVPSPTPTPVVPAVAFALPADGASVASGNITVTGSSLLVSSVTLTATMVGAPLAAGSTLPPATPTAVVPSLTPSNSPAASVGPTGTPGPAPVTGKTGADGSFQLTMQLGPGRWQLTIVGTSSKGAATSSVSRTISIPYKGINVLIQVRGGDAGVYFSHDGVVDGNASQADGWSVTVVGTKNVCINSSAPSRVYITFNGIAEGPVSGFSGSRVYIDANGPRYVTSC